MNPFQQLTFCSIPPPTTTTTINTNSENNQIIIEEEEEEIANNNNNKKRKVSDDDDDSLIFEPRHKKTKHPPLPTPNTNSENPTETNSKKRKVSDYDDDDDETFDFESEQQRQRVTKRPRGPCESLWLNRLKTLQTSLRKTIELEQQRLHIGSRIERTLGRASATDLCTGDMRLRNIRHTLNHLGIIRSADQIQFHEAFLQACLPKIYGSDWDLHSLRVMREFDIKRIRYEVLAMTPRRWGKTWSVATFVLALLLNVPGIKICIFRYNLDIDISFNHSFSFHFSSLPPHSPVTIRT